MDKKGSLKIFFSNYFYLNFYAHIIQFKKSFRFLFNLIKINNWFLRVWKVTELSPF